LEGLRKGIGGMYGSSMGCIGRGRGEVGGEKHGEIGKVCVKMKLGSPTPRQGTFNHFLWVLRGVWDIVVFRGPCCKVVILGSSGDISRYFDTFPSGPSYPHPPSYPSILACSRHPLGSSQARKKHYKGLQRNKVEKIQIQG
jgi:hypothetical protein